MRVLHPPVPADVGEQVLRRGVVRVQAGEVEDGLGPGVPLALLPVRDVPLDEQGLGRVLEPGAGGCREDADGAGLDPAADGLAGRGGDGRVLPVQRVEGLVQAGLVAQDGPQPVRVLRLPHEQGVVPVRLHGVAGDDGPGQRQRGQQGPEVADLVRLAGFGDPVLGDDDPGSMGDGGEQVHLPVPAGFRALALLAVDRDALARGNVPGIPAGSGVQPRVLRVRPEPAVLPFLPERLRGRRLPLPLLPLFLLLALLLRAVRGIRGRDSGIQRKGGHGRRQGSLELVGIQQLAQPVQHRRRRRHPQPGPRAHPAAVRRQHPLIPARRGLRDGQRPAQRGRRARDRHRDQRRQRMPLAPRPALIGQPPLQRLPQGHRIRRDPVRQVAADAVGKP